MVSKQLIIIPGILASLFLLSSQAIADSSMPSPNQYWGISFSKGEHERHDGTTGDTGNINIKAGYDFLPFLSAEVHLGGSVGEMFGSNTSSTNTSSMRYVAGFVRGNLPIKQSVNIYGLLGGAFVDVTHKNTLLNTYHGYDFTEPAIGVGIELYGNTRTAFTIEYMSYGLDETYTTLGVGLVHHFNWAGFRSNK